MQVHAYACLVPLWSAWLSIPSCYSARVVAHLYSRELGNWLSNGHPVFRRNEFHVPESDEGCVEWGGRGAGGEVESTLDKEVREAEGGEGFDGREAQAV